MSLLFQDNIGMGSDSEKDFSFQPAQRGHHESHLDASPFCLILH